MINWAVIVKRGEHLNITLSTIYYDKWGAKTKQQVLIVDDWNTGMELAKQQGHTHALFVNSGTVFVDWNEWKKLLDNYPHKGLVAHVIHHPGDMPYIDEQCWFQDLDLELHGPEMVSYPEPVRSKQNLHDDYTPLWIKPGNRAVTHRADQFGQNLIAQQLNRGWEIVNWTPLARELKRFIYSSPDFSLFAEYTNLAENQLWIFNNEAIDILHQQHIVCPGSGLFWVLNCVDPVTQQIDIVDISDCQIEFCKELWNRWSGVSYADFVIDFLTKHRPRHFEIDQANLSPMERLKFKNPVHLHQYIDRRFREILQSVGLDQSQFTQLWTQATKTKTVNIQKGNLVDWVIDKKISAGHQAVWISNILDYKWTLLHTTEQRSKKFQELMK